MFLKTLQIPQEDNFARVSFLRKFQAENFLKANKKTPLLGVLSLINLQAEIIRKARDKKPVSESCF